MATPLNAVTTTVTVFEPTLKAMGPDALPVVTALPFTVTEAAGSVVVGVTVTDVVPFVTISV